MKYFKNYNKNKVMPQKCWDDIFELLSTMNSPDVEQWLESRALSGFTIEEFIYFLNSIDQDEVQDWLFLHRGEFMALLSRPSFNFDNSLIKDSDNRWRQVFFLSPNNTTEFKE